MEYCYHLDRYRGQARICLFISLLFAAVFAGWAWALIEAQSLGKAAQCALGAAVSLGIGGLTFMAFLEMGRKYTLSETGVTLQYPFGFSATYTWDRLSEVGICNVHYTNDDPPKYLTVIRCVAGPEKNGPSKGEGWWTTSYYSTVRFRRIITITFTNERLKELKKVCPLEIVDYRGIKHYKLPRYTSPQR
jgi:hypothetical protein